MSAQPATAPRVSVSTLAAMRARDEPITMLTCYDASFAALEDEAGVDTVLVGDSLGMVIQGHDSTLPVTVADIAYHTRAVASATKRALVVADMPFGSYQESPAQALRNAVTLMEAGAQMVKLEGGVVMAPTVEFLSSRGIPVCGHIGLTPQSVHQLGGYRVQGKTDSGAAQLHADAQAIEAAGAHLIVVETVPAAVGAELTAALTSAATIGIGAGPGCAGQVLVIYDMLDIYPGRKARFVKNYLAATGDIRAAISAYVAEVKARTYPGPEHCF
jgi:3-methyl-2-oxobutanoate hydroxymethyltransferase